MALLLYSFMPLAIDATLACTFAGCKVLKPLARSCLLPS
eukprot:CAMPEP_0169396488 /NCGR_PEP_ID=MMETSP1017-20121227/51378_1 /TAXON_ID=342587 /ORGANISM="Karlodinium micrum, Strain CCMP2283" /LENGTH=38 /DNA_ID= /DNA_START= /DNA_END= /DNA_ORIENTATION=